MKRIFTPIVGLSLGLGILAAPSPAFDPTTKAPTTLEDLIGKVELPPLHIGSPAPELKIAKFVKGEPVSGFKKGQVYVVEFWATWCGPCVAAFPHLSDLQEKFGEQVRFIGVNVWEGVEDQAERNQKIVDFVADQGDRMRYTVAVEDGSAMADTWMTPAGQNGIPAAFVVDGTGHIAWVGHPSQIEAPLDEVLAGKFDPVAAARDAVKNNLMMAGFGKFRELIDSGKDIDQARQIANILVNQYLTEEPEGLNAIAWFLLNAKSPDVGEAEFTLAHKAIALANEKTGWKDWSLLDTYALAAFKTGHKDEAIKWQKKALELVPADYDDAVKDLKKHLATYEAQD